MNVHIFLRSETKGRSENAAVRTAIALAKDSPKVITILVPAKRHANGKPLTYVLSEGQVDRLIAGHLVRIADDVMGILESNQTLSTNPESRIIVAIRAWSDLIPKIQKLNLIEHLIVVAPNELEAQQWRKEFTTIEHNNVFNQDAGKAGAG